MFRKMRIAGIPRNPDNSPNMSDKDMQLFHEIAEELKKAGHTVEILGEEEHITNEYDAIFHMSRTTATLEQLAACETKGILVTNPTTGVRNCSRRKFVEILEKSNIKQPEYIVIDTTHHCEMPHFPGWLKKSEGWACNATDVQFVTTEEEFSQALATFAANGESEALFCKHIKGDIVKFYAVRGEDFFRWYYPNPTTTKFGLEKINGKQQKYRFDTEHLRETALRAAEAMNIDIFGGDCIITPEGEIYIIDINDFPSFSAYRSEAAKKIATFIINKNERNRS